MKKTITLSIISFLTILMLNPGIVNSASTVAFQDSFNTFSSSNWTIDPAIPENVSFTIGEGLLTLDAQEYTHVGNTNSVIYIKSKTFENDFHAILKTQNLYITTDSDLPTLQVGIEFEDGSKYGVEFGYNSQFIFTYDINNNYGNHGGRYGSNFIQGDLPKEIHFAKLGEDLFHNLKSVSQVEANPMSTDNSIYHYLLSGNIKEFVNGDQKARLFIGLKPNTTNQFSFTATFDEVKVTSYDNEPGTVYRMFSWNTGTHLYTTSINERNTVLRPGHPWVYDGATYSVEVMETEGSVPVYRFFNTKTGAHLYTISEVEKDDIMDNLSEYDYEGVVYYVYPTQGEGTIAVYRFFNTETGAHLYTVSETEKDSIINTIPEYTFEGVKYFVNP